MIKVQNDITKDRKDPLAEVLRDNRVREELLKKGIDLNRHAHPDYVFTMANGLKDMKPNTIAFERIDGCQVRNRHLLKNDNLLKLVKMYMYEDVNIQNLASVDGRIFTRFLSDNIKPCKQVISEDEYKKVTVGTSFLHYKRMDLFDSYAKHEYKKDIDIFFAGTTTYGKWEHESGICITKHRKNCVKALEELKKNTKLNIIVADNKVFNANEYANHMARAKLTVSPWGWGESCYRDYEAMLLKTDVIKPKSYKIASHPNIYDKTVFYCNPDWSNLEVIIEKCLSTFDSREKERQKTSKMLQEWREPKAIAGILQNIIKEVV